MTPFENAKRIVPIACPGKFVFVVSLANQGVSLPLVVTPSAQHADYIALVARKIIAAQISEAFKHEDCRLAAEIDQASLNGEIWLPQHAASLCRRLAELHDIELHRSNGQKDRQQPSGNSESAAPGGRNS
jgi:hypothetical protein